jgi:anaphase-promoting complex subunit 3
MNRLSPISWLVMGNAMSCNGEHEMAVKCFKRCIALDPEYAMAHTLCGLEYVLLEDLEQASVSLERAVCINPRDYKAWYGLGDICYKTEKYALCEVYLRKALSINSTNIVLVNHLALVCILL